VTARPDIVLVMPDQQRADSVSAYGNAFCATPVLDALARRGVRFANACTTFPLCTPARGSMWTGLYPHAHGVSGNVYGVPDVFADRAKVKRTLFHALRDAGYATAYFGKWHLGEANPGTFDA
jgi:choline-sulfatase